MKCPPQELLNAAVAIAATAKTEGMYRASVNRSYYASYHACIEYHASLSQVGTIGETKGVHAQLISQLTFPSKKLTVNCKAVSTTMGKYLRTLCDYRADADYDMSTPVDSARMDDALALAKIIFLAAQGQKSHPLAAA